MPDMDAITVALAARFASGAMTAPTGYDPITISTGNLPDQLLPTPCVLTFPAAGAFEQFGAKRDGVHEFIVRFYFNQTADLERDTVALRKWLTVLLDQLFGAVMLGGIVTRALINAYTMGILSYAGQDYTGIELTVAITTN